MSTKRHHYLMKSMHIMQAPGRQPGFALIENMVSILLLGLGALGIAASTASAIRINTDNQARAMALSVATKTLEPVYITATNPGAGGGNFAALIRTFATTSSGVTGLVVPGNVAAGASENFIVRITEAVDTPVYDSASGDFIQKDLLVDAPPYNSPVTVAVEVKYEGNSEYKNAAGDVDISKTKIYRTSFTYVLSG